MLQLNDTSDLDQSSAEMVQHYAIRSDRILGRLTWMQLAPDPMKVSDMLIALIISCMSCKQ